MSGGQVTQTHHSFLFCGKGNENMSQYCEQTKRIKFDSASAAINYLHSDQHVEQCKHCGYFHIVCDRPSNSKKKSKEEQIKESIEALSESGYLIYPPEQKEIVTTVLSSYIELRKRLSGLSKKENDNESQN